MWEFLYIYSNAFTGSTITGKITFPSKLLTIEKNAFQNSTLCNVDLSQCGILKTWDSAFAESTITGALELCTSWTEIATKAFRSTTLASIDFSQCTALTHIKEEAFYNSSLTHINLIGCKNLETLGTKAFGKTSKPNPIVILSQGKSHVAMGRPITDNVTFTFRTRREMISYLWYLEVGRNIRQYNVV